MRPSGRTAVASVITSAAPPTAREPRWTRCQSLASPSSEEYWHIGETKMRFGKVTPRSVSGSNRPGIRLLFHRENSSPRQMVCMRNVRETDTRLFGILECHRSHSGRRIDRRYSCISCSSGPPPVRSWALRRRVRRPDGLARGRRERGGGAAERHASPPDPASASPRRSSTCPALPIRRRRSLRRSSSAATTAASWSARPSWRRRSPSTASSTRRSIAQREADQRLHPDGAERGRAGDRAHRSLDDLRRQQLLPVVPLLGFGAARGVDRQRTAPRHQPAAPERHVRRAARHVSRSPQRLQLLHEPARRAAPIRWSPTRAIPTRTGTRCGSSAPAASRAAGRWRWRFRSSRSATSRATTRSGACRSAAPSAARTSGRT